MAQAAKPKLSVIVVVYNMVREAARTLTSLALPYQQGIHPDDYEVLVVENGSTQPLNPEQVASHGPQFRYYYHATRSVSPVAAINEAFRRTRGSLVGIVIDGARMFSPGLLALALRAAKLHANPVITPLAWHLGPDIQARSVQQGYSKEVEDRLLTDIGWSAAGYRLFEIASLAGASSKGYFQSLPESSALFMRRSMFEVLGGHDERFDLPGGGLANNDLYRRACEHPQSQLIVLLGEGTFHQLHGGVSTNKAPERGFAQYQQFLRQYRELRGCDFERPAQEPLYLGTVPPQLLRFLQVSCTSALAELPDCSTEKTPAWRRWLTRLSWRASA